MVDRFYVRMMADPFVSRFFAGIDMEKQRKKQTQFVTMAFGASPPPLFRGAWPAVPCERLMHV